MRVAYSGLLNRVGCIRSPTLGAHSACGQRIHHNIHWRTHAHGENSMAHLIAVRLLLQIETKAPPPSPLKYQQNEGENQWRRGNPYACITANSLGGKSMISKHHCWACFLVLATLSPRRPKSATRICRSKAKPGNNISFLSSGSTILLQLITRKIWLLTQTNSFSLNVNCQKNSTYSSSSIQCH